MKVKCINNEHEENCLTINKIYPVIRETETGYIITDDNSMDFIYLKSWFVPVKEEIVGVNMKVRCINNYYKNDCLTIDETYPVLKETETSYTIVDDKDKTSNYYKYRFVPVEEEIGKIESIARDRGEKLMTSDIELTIQELVYLNHILQQHKYKGDEIAAKIQKKIIEEINKN